MKTVRSSVVCGILLLVMPRGTWAQELKPRDMTARLVGHAHIDLSWLWRWEETVRDVAVETFRGTLAEMAKMPGLTFAQSQAALYEAVEAYDPDLFKAIRAKVKDGTWIPVGGMWVEPDLNMPDGEALARQLLYGKRYFLDKFGVDVKVGWNPDSFGHNGQLPQILSKAGISYYVFGRCAPDKTVAFTWKGRDGSGVLAYVPQGWYNVSLKDGLRTIVLDAAKISPLRDVMILYGEGDHGGGPRDADLDTIQKFRADKNQPKLEFVVPEAYFKILEKHKPDLPVVADELNFTFPACYTTQAETKKNNRKAEGLLVTAEKFSALAVASGFRDYYPERDIDEAWKIVLRNQFHDILDGSSIGPVYDEVRGFYQNAMERGRRALDFSLETITDQIDTRGEGLPFVLYNPLAWERTESVVIDIPAAGERRPFVVTDPDGLEVPYQIIPPLPNQAAGTTRVVFIARGVPAFGYALYKVVPAEKAPAPVSGVTATPTSLENEYFKVVLDQKTGWIQSIYDKNAGREILSGPANVLQAIVDEPPNMSAWELGLKDQLWNIGETGARVDVLESGPVRAVIRVQSPFRRSSFDTEVVVYAGLPRIDFRLRLNWQERNLMIKAAFPLNVRAGAAEFEIPYGSISRPANGAEVPALRWIDLSDASGDYGVGLLNDCKYGYDVKGNVARLSVIHGATNPDPEADRGRHEMFYALYPHRGTWQDAATDRRGYEFNNPLLPRIAMAHPGKFGPRKNFLSVEPANIVLSAVKKESGYSNRGVILRLYEAYGRPTEARLELPWPVAASETDLIERPLQAIPAEGKILTQKLGPYEIKTILVIPKSGP